MLARNSIILITILVCNHVFAYGDDYGQYKYIESHLKGGCRPVSKLWKHSAKFDLYKVMIISDDPTSPSGETSYVHELQASTSINDYLSGPGPVNTKASFTMDNRDDLKVIELKAQDDRYLEINYKVPAKYGYSFNLGLFFNQKMERPELLWLSPTENKGAGTVKGVLTIKSDGSSRYSWKGLVSCKVKWDNKVDANVY